MKVKFKAATTRISLLLAGLLLGILLVEAIFGAWIFANNLNHLNLVKSVRLEYDINDVYPSSLPTALYERDQYGLRMSYGIPSEIELVTIGGSTTDQRFIGEGQTWQDQLQSALRTSGIDLRIANAGVDGHSSFGHIESFQSWFKDIPDFKPRYYLFYIGINDLLSEYANYNDIAKSVQEILSNFHQEDKDQLSDEERAIAPALGTFERKSILLSLYRKFAGSREASRVKLNLGRRVLFDAYDWTTSALVEDYGLLYQDHVAEYRRRLEHLLELVAERHGVPIFVTQPARIYRFRDNGELEGKVFEAWSLRYRDVKINGVDYYHLLKMLNDTTLDVCKGDSRCIGIDAANEIQWENADFYDLVHNSPIGTEKLGSYLAHKLADADVS
jgi:lysophospholipase L1-like esterase